MASLRQNTFSGTWHVPGRDSKYKGELIHEKDENLWALHFADRHDDAGLTRLVKNPGKCIQGELENGLCVLLVDLEARHAGGRLFAYDDYLLFPKYVLEGIRIDSETVELGYLAFDFDDIVHWSGMCHFRYCGDNVEWEQEPKVVFECNDHSLTVFPRRYGPMSFIPSRKICLSQTVVFELRPTSEKPLAWFMEMIDRIKSLVTLGIQRKTTLNELRFLQPKDTQEPNNDEHLPRERSLHINLAQAEKTSDIHFLNHLFSFSALKKHPEVYKAWMDNYEKMKPIIDLRSLVFLYPDSPPEVIFLNLMQALETYHARFICDKPKKYSGIIDCFIDEDLEFYDDRHREDYRLYLKENNSKSSITLKARLRFLFAIDRFLYVPPANKCDLDSFIQKLVDSRNYYTHYDPKKESRAFRPDELPAINALISILLDYYILKKVSYPHEELTPLIHERFVRLDNIIENSAY